MLLIQRGLNFARLNLRHKEFLKRYQEIKKNQYLPYNTIKQNQLNSLNNLLTHAYNHIKYYHEKFKDLDIVKNNKVVLESLDEITKLPILTKEIISQEGSNLYSDDIDKRGYFYNTTGGSTGEPTEFIQDREYVLSNKVNMQLSLSWMGFELYDDMIVIWGAIRDTFDGKKPFKKAFIDFTQNRLVLNCFNMSEDDMRLYIDILNKHQPKLIKAYTQSMYEMAKFAKENNILVKKQNAIHLTTGTVYPFMREIIEEVFQCKAYNHYGSREAGAIASECSMQDGLHIMAEHTFVEVLDENGNPCKYGEEGEIFITTLANYSMPLIRYRIGDRGILMDDKKSCSCGCNYPRLEMITGRVAEVFKTASGSIVLPEYFVFLIGVVLNKGFIKKFQVIQEELERVVIKIVKSKDIEKDNLLEIEEKIKIAMGENCKVEFEFVDDIPKTKTGKYQYTISKI